MKQLAWDKEKNKKLKAERGISFEQVAEEINAGRIIDDIKHPNQKRYPNQRKVVIKIKEYVYLVPYVTDNEKSFLKTIIPSRKATKQYLKGK